MVRADPRRVGSKFPFKEFALNRVWLEIVEAAMSLWRGPPLAGFACEQFAQAGSACLDELRVGALEELVEARLALEGPDTAGGGIEPGALLVKLGERTGDKERALAGHQYRLNGFWTRADRVGVDVELDAIASLADELGQPAQRWILGTGQTMLALMEGRLADAEQLISETLEQGRRSQSWNAVVSERFALFILRRAQGRLAEFEDTIKRSVHEYPPLLRFRCALAHAYGELDRKHDASAVLDELITRDLGNEHVDAEWLLSMTLLADVSAFLDDPDAAAKLHGLLAPYEGLYEGRPGGGDLRLGGPSARCRCKRPRAL